MRELYRLASKYNLQPLQEKLQKAYPNQFNQKDMMWFEHGKTITSSKMRQRLHNKKNHLKN